MWFNTYVYGKGEKGGGYSLLARVRSENEGSEQNQLKFDKSHWLYPE